jgi:hypothetical protein
MYENTYYATNFTHKDNSKSKSNLYYKYHRLLLGIKHVKYAKDQTWLLLVFKMVDTSMSCFISYGAYIRKRGRLAEDASMTYLKQLLQIMLRY